VVREHSDTSQLSQKLESAYSYTPHMGPLATRVPFIMLPQPGIVRAFTPAGTCRAKVVG